MVESDWKPGSPVVFHKASGEPDHVLAKVIEAKPPRHLTMSWTYRPEAGQPPLPASRVTYQIEPAGPVNVKLTVLHEEFEPGSKVDESLHQGWPAILSSLKSYLETGQALDITKRWAREGR